MKEREGEDRETQRGGGRGGWGGGGKQDHHAVSFVTY